MSGYKCRTKLVKMHVLGHFNIWNFLCIHEDCESDSKSCLNKCVDTHKVYCIYRKKAALLTCFLYPCQPPANWGWSVGCWHGFLKLSLEWKLPSVGSKVSWLFDLSQIALEYRDLFFHRNEHLYW